MSVQNPSKLANHISNWLKDYTTKAGLKTLVLGLSGGIDSALVALLCKQTKLPLICVNMPCHSSNSAFERAQNFAREFSLDLVKVDLSAAHESIHGQIKEMTVPNADMENRIAVGGLRSCLRAPTLSFFANATKGLIVGTGNRSEDYITRYFQKYGDGCVDISPIADLFKSEVRELFEYLTSSFEGGVGVMGPAAKAIYDAKPTADLWGPDSGQVDEEELGISYEEIEWADREDMRTNVIFDDTDPAKRSDFFRYTARQQVVISKLHQLEKISRHKQNDNLPVCRIRHLTDLVQ